MRAELSPYTVWIIVPQSRTFCCRCSQSMAPEMIMIKAHRPKKASTAYSQGRTGAFFWVDQITSPPAHSGSAGST